MSSPSRQSTSLVRFITATDVAKSYAGRVVLDGVELRAAPGQRVGLIGENGSGKSTLLRLIAGTERPDAGTIVAPTDLAYLPQEPAYAGGDTVAAVLDAALAPLHDAVRDVELLSAQLATDPDAPGTAERYARRLEFAVDHDAWDADRRAGIAAARLGIDAIDPSRAIGTLSGGERTRLAVAAMIVTRPWCVLLDEPTNHLDDDAMELLEDFLVGLPGIVVAASHDRTFLDRVCTAIVDLDAGPFGTDGHGGRRFAGRFSDYLDQQADTRLRWEQTYVEQQEEISQLRRAAGITTAAIAHNRGPRDNDRLIYNFKGGKVEQAHARRKRDAERRLAEAERTQVRKPRPPLRFRRPLTIRPGTGELAVSIRDLLVRGRVDVPRLDVPSGGALLVTGENGSGKSSLLAAIAGRLPAHRGTIQVRANRIGLLEQDVVFDDPTSTAGQTFSRAVGPDARHHLAELGLLHPREMSTVVGGLSVGQRRRLGLAILVAIGPDLLLLDEPTNHISLALASELQEAFETARGTVIVASHDRWLRSRWAGDVLALDRPPVIAATTS